MRSIFAVVSFFTFVSAAGAASCPPHAWTDPARVKTGEGPLLIVTHPSTQWDGRFVSKLGMDATVAWAKTRNIPVVYLQDSQPSNAQTYFFSDCNPTYWVQSSGGEFEFAVTSRHVISVGGHWEMCQRSTFEYLIQRNWRNMDGDLRLTLVMDGIYSHPLSSMSPNDPFWPAMQKFLEIVTYGRPGSWPFPKTSLLENMGIIGDRRQQVEYLKRSMPSVSLMPARYEIRLVLNGAAPELVRPGQGPRPPVLTLEFIDSLYQNGPIPDHVGRDSQGRCTNVQCLRSRRGR